MSLGKVIPALAVLLTAWFVVFVLLGPASVVRPVSIAVLVIVFGAVVSLVRNVYLARRSASRNRPPA
ncbi:hypothetical protein [Nonomuraea sp. NPDC046570]|uniref:hypothetical protein n=1 Tax=Nonomuraea sp. NPDC046570 TaxID=3155255 RepID=UPI0033F33088